MKVFITNTPEDDWQTLKEIVNSLQRLPTPPKVYLLASGKFAWEVAAGLGITGVVATRTAFGGVVIEDVRILE